MTAWRFRCVCCGELRDAPMTRPEGNVYLRCIVSRQWAWYEPSAFVPVAASVSVLRLGGGGNGAKTPRAAAGRHPRGVARVARGAARTARGATRTSRGSAGRKATKRARKRR